MEIENCYKYNPCRSFWFGGILTLFEAGMGKVFLKMEETVVFFVR